MFENGLFIFRRDLRIQDNIGLNEAVTNCKNIYPIFIFTPEQVTEKNKFKSENAIQFMIESLDDLSDKYGSFIKFWILAPIMPWESIIQNNTRDPTRGVTIIGNIVPKIRGPLIFLATAFKLKAIINPNKRTLGVTNRQ